MLQGYELLESLGRTRGSILCRARRVEDRQVVLLKLLEEERPTPEQLARFRREDELLESLNLPEIPRPLAFVSEGSQSAMVLENHRGVRLETELSSPFTLVRALKLAVRLAHAVCGLHVAQLVHHDLRPTNLLVDPTAHVFFVDLSVASPRLPSDASVRAPGEGLSAGDLAFISPEQTGRVDYPVDHRSDLYSLGVLLYRVFSGVLPFHAADPLEWVHAHLARTPTPLAEVRPEVPPLVSDIVMKLLSKPPGERYQSARGLEVDLARCLEALVKHGRIEPFPLAQQDFTDRLELPRKLYGRRTEREELLEVYRRAANGSAELALVSGASGIGKSALVYELQQPIFKDGGVFVAGKCDPHRHDVPYAPFVQAFRFLVQQILAGSDELVREWRQRLTQALGRNAQVVTAILPELELIIGKPPPIPRVGSLEAQNRFKATLRKFLSAFPRPERPVALFLDDLQWADSASLELLQEILLQSQPPHLAVIGAYCDDEVFAGHPLAVTLQRLREAGLRFREMKLQPFTSADLEQLLADALHATPETAAPLAHLVRTKTGGEPFFATQFLTTLEQDHLIEFKRSVQAWRWDVARIASRDYTDDVVELMLRKLRRLPEGARQLLTRAACLGSSVDVATLAAISGKPVASLHEALWAAERDGLMLRLDGTYRFLHDRVRQGAYSLIPEAERGAVHLEIGRRLLAEGDAGGVDTFEIANQFMLGASGLREQEERTQIARLFLACGRKAKSSAAYGAAEGFFASALEILGETGDGLTWDLQLERADCAWLVGRFEEASRVLPLLLERATTTLQKLAVYEIQGRLHTIRGELERSIESGLNALRLIGLDLPAHPGDAEVQRAWEATWHQLGDRTIESLLELPPATDLELIAALGLAANMLDVAAFTDKKLNKVLACFIVSTSARAGNAESSPVGYAAFAMFLLELDRREDANRFGQLARDLLERLGFNTHRARVAMYVEGTLNPWIKPYRDGLAYLDSGAQQAAQNGDFLWSSYAHGNFVFLLFIAGEPLGEVNREVEQRCALVRAMKVHTNVESFVNLQRWVEKLRGRTPDAPGFDEAAWEAMLERERGPITVASNAIWKLQASVILGDHAAALAASEKAKANLWGLYRLSPVAEFQYYDALARAADYREEYRATIEAHEQALRAAAERCPENFASKHALVRAELERISGKELAAQRSYEEAIKHAKASGLVQNEALANELAARFYLSLGLDSIATTHLRQARACYARWGADAKVSQLDQRHPHLFAPRVWPPPPRGPEAVRAQQLDLLAVIKASQGVSQKIELTDLLETLMRVVLESAGAETASLLLVHGDELSLAVVAGVEPGGVSVRRGDDQAPSPSSMPLSILNYVRRSREHVLLNEDTQPNPFAADAYLARRRPKSILCLPILRQAQPSALLYLENNLVSHAFTPDRLTMLQLLAAQAAISLENAQLYTDLRHENAERRLAEAALTKSKALLQTVIDSASAAICVKDLEGRYLLVNEYFARAMRTDRAGLLGKLDADLFPPDEAEVIHGADLRVLAGGAPIELEERVRLHDGVHTFLANKAPLTDPSGRIVGVCGVETDITARKEAEATLQQTEQQLRLAQKMEAVGNLAGGIAHDFNNLLSIILSYSTLLARDMPPGDPRRADLQEIEAAGLRAAELTRQLLAFGRKQVLQPVILNLNDTLWGMERMLRRIIGEDIELTLTTDPGLGRTRVDPGQLEQIIMNLSVNSRDAMPRGGKLSLETSNVELDQTYASQHVGTTAGPHVMLSVTDTGVGMDQATQARMFEPFFTTKETGKGTGLGLATVFGIMQQSGGSIWVASEPGKGTTFKLYFPRVDAPAAGVAVPSARRPLLGTETILLVEDDESVRTLARSILQRFGYRVLEAQSGGDALLICEEFRGTIQLLVTDVIMPRMSGPQLAERLRVLRPEMKVLFMSGYTDDAVVHHGVLDAELAFLQKPITPETLTRKVREVLDTRRREQLTRS